MEKVRITLTGSIPQMNYLVFDQELLKQFDQLLKHHSEYSTTNMAILNIIKTKDPQSLFSNRRLKKLNRVVDFIENWKSKIALSHFLINDTCHLLIQRNEEKFFERDISNIAWNDIADPYEISDWDDDQLRVFNNAIREFLFPDGWTIFSADLDEFAERAVKGIKKSALAEFYNMDDSLFYKLSDDKFFEQNLPEGACQVFLGKCTDSVLVVEFETEVFEPEKLYFVYRNDIALKCEDDHQLFCNSVIYNKQEMPFQVKQMILKNLDLRIGTNEWPCYKN